MTCLIPCILPDGLHPSLSDYVPSGLKFIFYSLKSKYNPHAICCYFLLMLLRNPKILCSRIILMIIKTAITNS